MKFLKHPVSIILLLILICFVSFSQSKYPIIVIDDYYSHTNPELTDTLRYYSISPSKGILVDVTDYNFRPIRKMNEGKYPNLIFVICESGTFTVEIELETYTKVDRSTLKNIGDGERFKGFVAGDIPIIGIGTLKIDDGESTLKTFWLSKIKIE